jgi:hypothetical protein
MICPDADSFLRRLYILHVPFLLISDITLSLPPPHPSQIHMIYVKQKPPPSAINMVQVPKPVESQKADLLLGQT